jgi:phosphate transport system protein
LSHKKFRGELAKLKEDVLEMGKLARGMLFDSVTALVNHDLSLAESVLSRKSPVAKMDLEIEQDALRLVALYQPMAKDLRVIAACLKSITYINRVGRYGKDIANVVKELKSKQNAIEQVNLMDMCEVVCEMLDDALEAFRTEDISKINDISSRDDKVDSRRWSIFRECITYMMEDSRNITPCSYYQSVARYIERCGDHACKIAEKVHFMVTGELIEVK